MSDEALWNKNRWKNNQIPKTWVWGVGAGTKRNRRKRKTKTQKVGADQKQKVFHPNAKIQKVKFCLFGTLTQNVKQTFCQSSPGLR